MKFIFIAESKKSLISFFAWWKVIIFVCLATLILLILTPKYLFTKIVKTHNPSAVTLSYLHAFREKDPQDPQLLLALIEQEVGLGQLKKAKKNIRYLKKMAYPMTADMNNQLLWLNYLMLRYKAYHTKMNTPLRISYLRQLRQLAAILAEMPLSLWQLKIIAQDSLGLAKPALALKIYTQLMAKNALTTPEELAEGGNIAMQNNAQLDSAKFYWAAYNKAREFNEKKQYAFKTIESLWAGNFVQKSLLTALHLPDAFINERHTLLYLTRLAIAANRLDVAEQYALKAVINSNTEVLANLRKMPYDDEGFKLLFKVWSYNAKIPQAYQLALIAVAKKPNDLVWHANLAKTATWVGEYNLGMKEWLYVVRHEKNIKKIKQAILMAKILGYDPVVVDMLKIYLIKNPGDINATLDLAKAQNRIGEPQQALLTLQKLIKIHPTRKAYELTAEIYHDLSQWDKALKIWQRIDKQYGPNTHSVIAQSVIYYSQGQFQHAVDVLKTGILTAKTSDKDFWDTLANLAWIVNDRKLAILSYSHDLTDSSNLLHLTDLEKLTNPHQALIYSLRGWVSFHNPLFFSNALYLAQQLKQWQLLSDLFTQLSVKQFNVVGQMQVYWQILANLYGAMGLELLQERVLVQGILQHPLLQQLKSDLLWLVITKGDVIQIKALLHTWYKQHLMNDPSLWHAFSEALGVFNQLNRAISIYQHHLFENSDNDQVMIDYANLLEKARLYQQAYQVRVYLWQRLLLKLNQDELLEKETLQALSQLAPYFVSGTDQIQFLNALMKNPMDDQTINLILNWLVQNNYVDLIAFFKANYTNYQLTDRIAIYLALVQNDLPTLQNIMANSQNTLPRADRINAAIRLENTPRALGLAFSELTERPLATEIYTEFTQYGVANANRVRVAQEYEQFIDLIGQRTRFETKLRLSNEWKIRPYFSRWNLGTNSPTSITNVPAHDLQAGIKLDEKIHRGLVSYSLGYRDALNDFIPAAIDLNYQLAARWNANVNIGYNQEAFQTAFLRIGGVADQISLGLIYNLAKYDSIQAQVQGFNYYSQNRHYLAEGYFLHGLVQHQFWLSYPDYTIALFGNVYHFNKNGSYGGDITTLFLPPTPQQQANPTLVASTQAANYQQLVPPSYNEGGFIFSVGNAILDYTRAWRPYLWASVYYNSYVGLSNEVKLGINGSVFGRDSLLFYADHGTSPGVANAVNQMLGVQYSLYF